MVYVRKLENPTEEQIQRATQVFFNSIGQIVPMKAGCGWDESIIRDTLRARVEVGTADGWIYAASVNEGEIDGLVYITPPGYAAGESRTVPTGVPKFRDRCSPEIQKWHNEVFFPWFDNFTETSFGPTGVKDSLYLNLLGVDESKRGAGIGSALLRKVNEIADAENWVTTLFTEKASSARLYGKFGFQLVHEEEHDIRGQTVHDYAMRRPARDESKAAQTAADPAPAPAQQT